MPAQSALSEAFPEARSSTLLLPMYLLELSPMAPPLLQGGLENVVLFVENIAPSNKSYFCWEEEREDEPREASTVPAPGAQGGGVSRWGPDFQPHWPLPFLVRCFSSVLP